MKEERKDGKAKTIRLLKEDLAELKRKLVTTTKERDNTYLRLMEEHKKYLDVINKGKTDKEK